MINKAISVLLLISIFVFTAMAQQKSNENIHITINPENTLFTIPDNFTGFGYETSAVANKGFFSDTNHHMVQLYKTLGPKGLIRIGGIIGDWTHYKKEGIPIASPQKQKTIVNQEVLNDLGRFLQKTGWQVMWTLNLGTGTKEEAVEAALAVQKALGGGLHSFEIGNEVSLLKRFKDYADYHKTYLEYKAAIRAVMPNAVFSGADIASNGDIEWSLNFARDESKDMGLLIHHYYRGGANSKLATVETLLGPHPISDERFGKLRDVSKEQNVQFRINEMNSFTGGGKEGVSDSFVASLWTLDNMFRIASYGGVGVNMQTDVNQLGFISYYTPIFRDSKNQLKERAVYYGMLAFSLAGKGELIQLDKSEHSANFSGYATQSENSNKANKDIWLTFINKDLSKNITVDFNMPAGYTNADVIELSAPFITSKHNITLGGSRVNADGSWVLKKQLRLTSNESKSRKLVIPSASAVLVRLR